MAWKCKNIVKNEEGVVLFKPDIVYEEGDDRGDCDSPEDIAICLFDETGNRTYLFNDQVTNNFTEISEMYTKEQILTYLKEQKDIKAAIINIDALGKNLPYVWSCDSEQILFYLDENTLIRSQLKAKIYEYAKAEGWEKADYCKDMSCDEVLVYFNLKVKKKMNIRGILRNTKESTDKVTTFLLNYVNK